MNTNRHSWIDRPAASAARALCFAALLLTSEPVDALVCGAVPVLRKQTT